MTNGDMRNGSCTVCGGGEVYRGDFAPHHGVLREPDTHLGGKTVTFDAYVCASCGHTQLHTKLRDATKSYVRRKLERVRP